MTSDLTESEDPSTRQWGHPIFDEEFPLATEPDQIHLTHLRIIVDGDSKSFDKLRLELNADSDLFFLYEAEFTAEQYQQVSEEQALTLSFDELPGALMELVRNIAQGSTEFLVDFTKTGEAQAALVFEQQLRFKRAEIIRVEFTASSPELVSQSLQFRFDVLKQKTLAAQQELLDLCAMLKIKNPSLLKQVRSPGK
jgi:hypothetical protein